MLKRLLILVVGLLMVDSALGGRNRWKNQHGTQYFRGPGGNMIRVGSDKHYLWDHDLSDKTIKDRNDLEFQVSDGNDKIITCDGLFSANGEILATDGIWLNKKKFAVYVPKWKGWWVGKVIFNGQDNVRGMKTMFIRTPFKTSQPPPQVYDQKPHRLEKGSLYFKTYVKSTDFNNNGISNIQINEDEDADEDDTCGASNGGQKHHKKHKKHGKRNKNGKRGKHGHKNKNKNKNKEHGHWHWHEHEDGEDYHEHDWHHHGDHHGHHHGHGCRCCGIFGRVIGVVGILCLVGLLFVGIFRAAFDDVFEDCCLLSVLKIKLDLENREFRVVWKNKNDDKGENKHKKNKDMKNDGLEDENDKNKEDEDENDNDNDNDNDAPIETSKDSDSGEK